MLVVLLGAVTCYPYFQMKTLLEMAEASINDLLPEVSYDPRKLDAKRQKLIECALTGNSKQYLGRLALKNESTSLVRRKWISSLAITK